MGGRNSDHISFAPGTPSEFNQPSATSSSSPPLSSSAGAASSSSSPYADTAQLASSTRSQFSLPRPFELDKFANTKHGKLHLSQSSQNLNLSHHNIGSTTTHAHAHSVKTREQGVRDVYTYRKNVEKQQQLGQARIQVHHHKNDAYSSSNDNNDVRDRSRGGREGHEDGGGYSLSADCEKAYAKEVDRVAVPVYYGADQRKLGGGAGKMIASMKWRTRKIEEHSKDGKKSKSKSKNRTAKVGTSGDADAKKSAANENVAGDGSKNNSTVHSTHSGSSTGGDGTTTASADDCGWMDSGSDAGCAIYDKPAAITTANGLIHTLLHSQSAPSLHTPSSLSAVALASPSSLSVAEAARSSLLSVLKLDSIDPHHQYQHAHLQHSHRHQQYRGKHKQQRFHHLTPLSEGFQHSETGGGASEMISAFSPKHRHHIASPSSIAPSTASLLQSSLSASSLLSPSVSALSLSSSSSSPKLLAPGMLGHNKEWRQRMEREDDAYASTHSHKARARKGKHGSARKLRALERETVHDSPTARKEKGDKEEGDGGADLGAAAMNQILTREKGLKIKTAVQNSLLVTSTLSDTNIYANLHNEGGSEATGEGARVDSTHDVSREGGRGVSHASQVASGGDYQRDYTNPGVLTKSGGHVSAHTPMKRTSQAHAPSSHSVLRPRPTPSKSPYSGVKMSKKLRRIIQGKKSNRSKQSSMCSNTPSKRGGRVTIDLLKPDSGRDKGRSSDPGVVTLDQYILDNDIVNAPRTDEPAHAGGDGGGILARILSNIDDKVNDQPSASVSAPGFQSPPLLSPSSSWSKHKPKNRHKHKHLMSPTRVSASMGSESKQRSVGKRKKSGNTLKSIERGRGSRQNVEDVNAASASSAPRRSSLMTGVMAAILKANEVKAPLTIDE